MISLQQLRRQNLKWLSQQIVQTNHQIAQELHNKKIYEQKKRFKMLKLIRRLMKKYHKRKRQQYRKHQEQHLLSQYSLFSRKTSEPIVSHEKNLHLTCS